MKHENKNDTIVLGSSSRFETCTFDLEGLVSKFDVSSGQGQVMTEVGQYAYLPKLLDEPSRLTTFVSLYLHPVARHWRKQDFGLI